MKALRLVWKRFLGSWLLIPAYCRECGLDLVLLAWHPGGGKIEGCPACSPLFLGARK